MTGDRAVVVTRRVRHGAIRRALAIATAGGIVAAAAPAGAQDRLLTSGSASAGVIVEQAQFGSGGLSLGSPVGGSSQRVKSATQFTVPIAVAIPLGDRWRVDVAAAYTSGSVRFANTTPSMQPLPDFSESLNGVSDVRLRATGRLLGDNLLLTVGVNAPTGVHALDTAQINALGVLAAPALGIHLPAVGLGAAATTGLVYATSRGDWAWAAGASFEVRGSYSPVASLVAGFPNPTFEPGNAVHLSLSTDGPVGQGALNLVLTADIHMEDKLTSAASTTASTVRLGPIIGGELRWALPATLFRHLVLRAGDQFRSPFLRDHQTVSGTGGNYLTAGLDGELPLKASTAITFGIDAWQQSRLSVNQSLITAGTTAGSLTLGLSQALGSLALHPFVAVRGGSIDSGLEHGSVAGFSAGLTIVQRF